MRLESLITYDFDWIAHINIANVHIKAILGLGDQCCRNKGIESNISVDPCGQCKFCRGSLEDLFLFLINVLIYWFKLAKIRHFLNLLFITKYQK